MRIFARLLFIMCSPIFAAGQLWTTLNPLPTPNSLYQVEFLSQDTGFIAGSNSTFMRTNDGGLSWNSIPFPADGVQLTSLNFFGKKLGVLVSWSHIYITKDGGNSWDYKKKQLSGDYTNSFFINDTVGWLCGTYQIVTKTTDGGLSWQTLSNQTSGAMHYFDIEFANENTGYVAGYNWDTPSQPVLKRSDDGGHTWFEIVLPADVYKLKDIFVFSPDELWIAVGNASFSPENNGFIAKAYHSTDGGLNWENHELGICHSSAGLNRIRFDDPIHGWALSESHLFITDDGGQNWESKPMTSSMWMSMQDGCHPHDNVFFTVSSLPEILKSSDNGTTWNPQTSGIKGYFNDIRFSDDLNGFLCGFDFSESFLYKTEDGGISWQKTYSQARNGISELVEIALSAPGIVYALSNQNFVIKSEDGGNSWVNITFNTGKEYKHIAAPTPSTIILGASDGSILKTMDGGFSWNEYQMNLPFGYTLYDSFEFADNLTGFASLSNNGSVGKLMYTIDGGMNWEISDYGSSNKVISLSCANANTWLISIANEGLAKTMNTGESWELINGSSALTNTNVKAFDDLIFLAAYRSATVSVSFDGGETWEVATNENPQGSVIKKHWFISPVKGWNMGVGNMIQTYYNPTLSVFNADSPAHNANFIYPNPSSGRLNIQMDHWKTIEFIDMKGCTVKELDYDHREQLNNLSLPTGIYFVQLHAYDKRFVQKILIF